MRFTMMLCVAAVFLLTTVSGCEAKKPDKPNPNKPDKPKPNPEPEPDPTPDPTPDPEPEPDPVPDPDPDPEPTSYVPFGTTKGGEGGVEIEVTNLNKSGPGSFAQALLDERRRIIVFKVSGVIDLDGSGIKIRSPHLTVAGETSPHGIEVIRGSVTVMTNNVIVRHIAFRPGDGGDLKLTGDAFGCVAEVRGATHHILVEHCSFTWAVDECASISGDESWSGDDAVHHVTFRRCIFAEGLDDSNHSKGPHSKASLVNAGANSVEYTENLFALCVDRCGPKISSGNTVSLVNNLMYGMTYRNGAIDVQEKTGQVKCRLTAIGNVLVAGPGTPGDINLIDDWPKAEIYARGNDDRGKDYAEISTGEKFLPEGLRPLPSSEVEAKVLLSVGTQFDFPADERIIDHVIDRSGTIIDSQEDVGGYPR